MSFIARARVFVTAILLVLLVLLLALFIKRAPQISTHNDFFAATCNNTTSTFSITRSSGVRGYTNRTKHDNTDIDNTTTAICLVSLINIEKDEAMKGDLEDNHDDEILVCSHVSSKYNNGVSDGIIYLKNLDANVVRLNREALRKNEWFIEYNHKWVHIDEERHTKTVRVPQNCSVITIDPSSVPHHHSIDPTSRRKLGSKLEKRQRKLTSTVGTRRVVLVAVESSISDSDLLEYAFGETDSLKAQMEGCSQGQLNIVPHADYPVIHVAPKRDPSRYKFVDLYSEVLPQIKEKLGLDDSDSVTDVTEHLFLLLPDEISRRPGELGWGSTPGFFAGIIESLAPSTMTMLHEIGHNLGQGHAMENNVAYNDMSTVMGYSHRNVVKMCYNAHNMWAFGWFPDRRYEIDLSDQDKEIVTLAFYGDYAKTRENQFVILKYMDAYMSFNRKKSVNFETKEYADMLLVVQEVPDEYHSHTNLIAALAAGDDAHMMKTDKDKVYIQVCLFMPGNDSQPDRLTVAVSRTNDACPF